MEGVIALMVWVGQFGPSKILRCGNGNEFKLLSGGFSQRGIEQAGHCASRAFLVYFFNYFYILFLCIYLMYNTVDSISYQLAILHMPGVIYMPSRNGPEHTYVFWAAHGQFKQFLDLIYNVLGLVMLYEY